MLLGCGRHSAIATSWNAKRDTRSWSRSAVLTAQSGRAHCDDRDPRTVEERFQTGKGLVGLDQHQVRCWRSWYRWTTLAMFAHAFLIVAALTERTRHPSPSGLIGLTCNELQHLFAALVARPTGDLDHRVRWSVWRCRHQVRARSCHYRRQAAQQP